MKTLGKNERDAMRAWKVTYAGWVSSLTIGVESRCGGGRILAKY